MKKITKTTEDFNQPYMISEASVDPVSTSRRNIAGTIERTDRFKNIEDGLVPFKYNSSSGSVDVRDAVILCQKCYYNFSIFRNFIDLMTEFSVSSLFWRGGSSKSKDFFKAFWNKHNMWDLQDRFFREYYRSGNVVLYRFDYIIEPSEAMKIIQVFGADAAPQVDTTLRLPARYVVLNPADIHIIGAANFSYGTYHKVLNEYEIARLRSPQTDEDRELFDSLPPQVQKLILQGNRQVIIPLDPRKIHLVFYKKQDYEPFSVPMGFPVLEAINAKAEMMKIDMAVARSMQQIILVVTNGTEPEKGGINQKNLEALRKLFTNQSASRVLVADYTTKADFVVPKIGELLDPKKYEVLEREINTGLNNVFAGGEKFANQAQKVELFVARLEQARKAFLNNFLIPEVKRIAKLMGFKNFPIPYFEDIELKDNINYSKIYARLMEIGLLTPEQGLKAIESNTLPDETTFIEEHTEYKKERDDGLFQPLVGGPKDGEAGAPGGPAAMPKKVGPIGAKASEEPEKYSLTKVKENLVLASVLEADVITYLREKHNIRRITKLQKEVAQQITSLIVTNEEPSNWKQSIATYAEAPEDRNKERVNQVIEIAARHGIDPFLAGVMLASKK